jgi:hypothetical protein
VFHATTNGIRKDKTTICAKKDFWVFSAQTAKRSMDISSELE